MEAGITTDKFYNTRASHSNPEFRAPPQSVTTLSLQLEALGVSVLIDRLIARRLFAFAIKVAEFKKHFPGERVGAGFWPTGPCIKVEAPARRMRRR